jgi:hypothetical protein
MSASQIARITGMSHWCPAQFCIYEDQCYHDLFHIFLVLIANILHRTLPLMLMNRPVIFIPCSSTDMKWW